MQAKSVKLVLRYEAAARRWYRESLAAAKSGTHPPAAPRWDEPAAFRNSPVPAMRDRPAPAAKPEPAPATEAPPAPNLVEAFLREQRAAVSAGFLGGADIDFDDESEADAEPELASACVSAPAAPAGKALNRHQRRRRDALTRRGG